MLSVPRVYFKDEEDGEQLEKLSGGSRYVFMHFLVFIFGFEQFVNGRRAMPDFSFCFVVFLSQFPCINICINVCSDTGDISA